MNHFCKLINKNIYTNISDIEAALKPSPHIVALEKRLDTLIEHYLHMPTITFKPINVLANNSIQTETNSNNIPQINRLIRENDDLRKRLIDAEHKVEMLMENNTIDETQMKHMQK
jgi:hypothetical protein